MTADPLLVPLIAQATGRQPMRAWSIVVSIFGDAALPFGGRLALSSLTQLTDRLGIDPGVVRVSAHRLVRDGLLTRDRIGRQAFYSLTASGRQQFETASRRIYGPLYPASGTPWRIALRPGPVRTARASPVEDWVDVSGVAIGRPGAADPGAEGSLVIGLDTSRTDRQRIAALVYPLGPLSDRYRRLQELLSPLADHRPEEPVGCLLLRILAIHEYRRVALNDPGLPRDCLPEDWEGVSLRRTIAGIYARVTPGANQWLAQQDGVAMLSPAQTDALARRFDPG